MAKDRRQKLDDNENVKSLGEFFSSESKNEDNNLYPEDIKMKKRKFAKGTFSKSSDCFDFIRLLSSWPLIVGKLLSENTIPQKLVRGTLFIASRHQVFASELMHISQSIILKIEKDIPKLQGKIRRLKFIHSEKIFIQQKRVIKQQNVPEKNFHRFDPKAILKEEHAKSMFKHIEDEELREILVALKVSSDNN